jgi:hypothetical protein
VKTRAWAGIGLFLYVWLMVGFATGTATLLGPARWITGALRDSAWSAWEDRAMIAVIVVYVAASFLLSAAITAYARRSRYRRLRTGIPAVATLCAVLSLWGWSNPAVYATVAGGLSGSPVTAAGAQFVFGPYPDRARLEELKKDGFAGVVSLQHPAVVPFEPQGISAERESARQIGIEFIHAPMLPWVSSNEASLETIRGVARRGTGRYYVHCGLGRDRTNVVKRMLEKMGAATAGGTQPNTTATSFAARLAEGRKFMERGAFREVEKDIWVLPYPNEHELYGLMLAGQVSHVLVLFDPRHSQQEQWAGTLRKVFTDHGVPATFEAPRPGSRAWHADVMATARALPRPLAIVVPHMPPHPFGEPGRALVEDWTGARWAVGPTWPHRAAAARPAGPGAPRANTGR